jgi:hypothetical protein
MAGLNIRICGGQINSIKNTKKYILEKKALIKRPKTTRQPAHGSTG